MGGEWDLARGDECDEFEFALCVRERGEYLHAWRNIILCFAWWDLRDFRGEHERAACDEGVVDERGVGDDAAGDVPNGCA